LNGLNWHVQVWPATFAIVTVPPFACSPADDVLPLEPLGPDDSEDDDDSGGALVAASFLAAEPHAATPRRRARAAAIVPLRRNRFMLELLRCRPVGDRLTVRQRTLP